MSPKASLSVRVLAMVAVALNRRRWAVKGVYLTAWRVTVERGRAVRSMEGLVLACASERMHPTSAARSCVRALLNMAVIREMGSCGERDDSCAIGDVECAN